MASPIDFIPEFDFRWSLHTVTASPLRFLTEEKYRVTCIFQVTAGLGTVKIATRPFTATEQGLTLQPNGTPLVINFQRFGLLAAQEWYIVYAAGSPSSPADRLSVCEVFYNPDRG